ESEDGIWGWDDHSLFFISPVKINLTSFYNLIEIKHVLFRFFTVLLRKDMMIHRLLLIVLFFGIFSFSFSQSGGRFTNQFLNHEYSARQVGLGSDVIFIRDNDLNMGISNPANLNSEMSGHIIFNQGFLPSGIAYGQAGYGHEFDSIGVFSFNFKYLSYGEFTRTDESGVKQGTFTAADFIISAGYGRTLNQYFSVGANLNLLTSAYDTYTSFGVSVDLAGTFRHEKSNITMSLMLKNLGVQFKSFTQKNQEALPLNIMLGLSYKFHKAPFRLGLSLHNLQNWKLAYQDPNSTTIDPITGQVIPTKKPGFGEELLQHMSFSIEAIIAKKIFIRVGFNYHRRQQMKILDKPGAAGLSFGGGFSIKMFRFGYGLAFYDGRGLNNVFSISTNINEWKKKGEIPSADPKPKKSKKNKEGEED
ncbi:MAG: type IX secretion system protein PorQ, partial [Crocinitomicaceae bacterium]|nr:type IX secretion system protein PorQ [Crocinitomicaceae bacterium]